MSSQCEAYREKQFVHLNELKAVLTLLFRGSVSRENPFFLGDAKSI